MKMRAVHIFIYIYTYIYTYIYIDIFFHMSMWESHRGRNAPQSFDIRPDARAPQPMEKSLGRKGQGEEGSTL